jgi:hypothetical protein
MFAQFLRPGTIIREETLPPTSGKKVTPSREIEETVQRFSAKLDEVGTSLMFLP